MQSAAHILMMTAEAAQAWSGYLSLRAVDDVGGGRVVVPGSSGNGQRTVRAPRFGGPCRVLAGQNVRVVRDGRTVRTRVNGGGPDGQAVDVPHPLGELYTAVTVTGGAGQSGGVPGMSGPTDVAIIDVFGPLVTAEADAIDWWSGERIGTTYGMALMSHRSALADPKIGAIVARYNSPGGEAVGATPAANELFDLAFGDGEKVDAGSGMSGRNGRPERGGKPIVAFADGMMASAALYLGAQAHAVLTSPMAITGSIGTMATFVEYSRLLDRIGITVNTIKNPDHKDAGSSARPMETADRARLQSLIDTFSAQFRADLGRGRRVTAGKVDQWVQQMTFVGRQAALAGLADGVVNGLEGAIRAAWGMRKK